MFVVAVLSLRIYESDFFSTQGKVSKYIATRSYQRHRLSTNNNNFWQTLWSPLGMYAPIWLIVLQDIIIHFLKDSGSIKVMNRTTDSDGW